MSASQSIPLSRPTTLEGELWADVPDYPGYRVSTFGRAKSQRHRNGMPSEVWRLLKPVPDGKGYPSYRLSRPGNKPRWFGAHQLVLLAFVGPAPAGQVARHVDNNDPWDCRLENLAYGTHAQNCRDKDEHGTDQRGERHPLARLSAGQVQHARREVRRIIRELAGAWDIPAETLTSAVSGRTWGHLTE